MVTKASPAIDNSEHTISSADVTIPVPNCDEYVSGWGNVKTTLLMINLRRRILPEIPWTSITLSVQLQGDPSICVPQSPLQMWTLHLDSVAHTSAIISGGVRVPTCQVPTMSLVLVYLVFVISLVFLVFLVSATMAKSCKLHLRRGPVQDAACMPETAYDSVYHCFCDKVSQLNKSDKNWIS